jgi:AP-3 complex subunit delta-1
MLHADSLVARLRELVRDPDQNLKYLGLVGFVNLMKSYPKTVVDHKELVLRCLSDDDITIRMKALELLTGMVTVIPRSSAMRWKTRPSGCKTV